MLAEMGFEPTLCQKAVGMFGDDMGAAVAWLTDDQAQQTQRTQQRSPEWALAEELAGMLGSCWLGLGLGLGFVLGLGLGLGLALAEELI